MDDEEVERTRADKGIFVETRCVDFDDITDFARAIARWLSSRADMEPDLFTLDVLLRDLCRKGNLGT